jgi:hypothetical protein
LQNSNSVLQVANKEEEQRALRHTKPHPSITRQHKALIAIFVHTHLGQPLTHTKHSARHRVFATLCLRPGHHGLGAIHAGGRISGNDVAV